MGKKMNSILLSLFLVFAFVLSGCSVETKATTATVDATTVNEGTSQATATTAEDTTAAKNYEGESLTILMLSLIHI